MKHLLNQLVEGEPLTRAQATEAFELIMTGQASAAQTGALLAMLQQRGPTVEEITGATAVMREKVTRVPVPEGLQVIDTCGTGGDHACTFNISTAAAIIAAAVARPHGVAVAKHGNRSVTSASGSSQVLEALGVKIQVEPETLSRCLDQAGLCFCFAPLHHPAMKHAGPVRAELGFRTIFNVVGPLTNPAGAGRQLVGVFAAGMTETIAQVLQNLGAERAMVVHGLLPDADGQHTCGLDELSTAGPTRVTLLAQGQIQTEHIHPDQLDLPFSHPSSLRAESPQHSAGMIQQVLAGEHSPARDIACLNAAAALVVAELAEDLGQGLAMAIEAVDRGQARAVLEQLVELTAADPTPAG